MDKKRLVDGTTALAEKRPRVIKIEPAERPQNVRLRVAAYTRVSSDSEDQLNSFAAQNRYYTELISGKAEWRMAQRSFNAEFGKKIVDTDSRIEKERPEKSKCCGGKYAWKIINVLENVAAFRDVGEHNSK